MKTFKDYLEESTKNYQYVIKLAMAPTDKQLELIETFLKRYDLRKMEGPRKASNDDNFIDITNRQVHEIVAEIGVPVSQYILLQDLKSAVNISENFMVVRSMNEPIELYSQVNAWNKEIDDEVAKDGDINGSRLSTDREYRQEEQPPVTDLFGNEYNKKLLAYLAGVADARPTKNVDPPAPLFSWIKLKDVEQQEPKQDTADFNGHIDSVKPVSNGDTTQPVDSKWTTNSGTMSDDSIPTVRFLKNQETGKSRQIVKPSEKI